MVLRVRDINHCRFGALSPARVCLLEGLRGRQHLDLTTVYIAVIVLATITRI